MLLSKKGKKEAKKQLEEEIHSQEDLPDSPDSEPDFPLPTIRRYWSSGGEEGIDNLHYWKQPRNPYVQLLKEGAAEETKARRIRKHLGQEQPERFEIKDHLDKQWGRVTGDHFLQMDEKEVQ